MFFFSDKHKIKTKTQFYPSSSSSSFDKTKHTARHNTFIFTRYV